MWSMISFRPSYFAATGSVFSMMPETRTITGMPKRSQSRQNGSSVPSTSQVA